MNCSTCPRLTRFFCIFACPEINQQLDRLDDELREEGR